MSSEDTIDYQNEEEICVVCGRHAADNGGFTRINHRGNTITLCGSDCIEAFSGEPDSYLARLRLAFESRECSQRLREACSSQT